VFAKDMISLLCLQTILCGTLGAEPSEPVHPYVISAEGGPPLNFLEGTIRNGGRVAVGRAEPPHYVGFEALATAGTDARMLRTELMRLTVERSLGNFKVPPERRQAEEEKVLRRPIYVAGDDLGLGFTPAPPGVTAFANWEAKQIQIRWSRPTTGYPDHVWMAGLSGLGCYQLSGESLSFPWKIHSWVIPESSTGLKPGQFMFTLIAVKDRIPSGPASLFVDQCRFIEATDPPFVNGLHPNWERVGLAENSPPSLSAGERKPGDERPLDRVIHNGGWYVPREYESPEVPKGKAAWTLDPGLKTRFQVMREPTGIGAIRRRIVAEIPDDRFHVSVRLRTRDAEGKIGGAGDVAYVWNGDPAALEGVLASGSGAIAMHPDLIPLDPTGEPNKYGWTEFSTEGAAPLGVPPSANGLETSLVIVAENLGPTQLEIDWLTVEKLNCTSEMPADYDPYGVWYTMVKDPETGKDVRVEMRGPRRQPAETSP
jgi:hypothetical protein